MLKALVMAASLSVLALLAPAMAQTPKDASASQDKQDSKETPPGRSPIHIVFEGNFEDALRRAKRLGRPIVVAVHKPSVKYSRRMLDEVYTSPFVRPLMREFVCIAACSEAVAPIDEGPRKGKSSTFKTVTVAEHQACAKEVASRYLGDEADSAPQHLFLDSAGHLIERVRGYKDADDFRVVLEKILDKADPGWRPSVAAVVAKRSSKGKARSSAVPFADLFEGNKTRRQRAAAKLVAVPDKNQVLELFKKVVEAETRAMIVEEAWRSKGDRQWLPAFVRVALEDKASDVRAEAAVACVVLASPKMLDSLFASFEAEKDDYVRGQLLRALANSLGAKDAKDKATSTQQTRVWKLVLHEAKSRSSKVRARAYVAMAYYAKTSDAARKRGIDSLISRGLKDRDRAGRSAAVWALADLGSKRARSAIQKLIPRERNRRLREFYARAIERFDGNVADWKWAEDRRRLSGR